MRILIALMGVVLSTSAFAHTGHVDTASVMNGFMHPVTGLDHVAAMVAVGVLAFLMGGRAVFALPLSFMATMLVGGVIALSGFELPLVETAIGASIVVISGFAAFGAPFPAWVSVATVAFFGVFHGFAHGAEMPLNTSGFAYAVGFIAATALLHAAGLAAAFSGTKILGKHSQVIIRAFSAAMMVFGGGLLAS